MRVVITVEAQNDLAEIAAYLRDESPVQAGIIINRLELACLDLSRSAGHYPLLPRFQDRGVRRRVVVPYNVIYRVRDDLVEIVHVLHGARDADRILFPED